MKSSALFSSAPSTTACIASSLAEAEAGAWSCQLWQRSHLMCLSSLATRTVRKRFPVSPNSAGLSSYGSQKKITNLALHCCSCRRNRRIDQNRKCFGLVLGRLHRQDLSCFCFIFNNEIHFDLWFKEAIFGYYTACSSKDWAIIQFEWAHCYLLWLSTCTVK